MTEIQTSIRKFLQWPPFMKSYFASEHFGYNSAFGNDEQDKLFFKWVKENNRLMAFVVEILEVKIEEEPFLNKK